ncbi:DUF916 and DUF3324 domain-containing protein [Enterococcus sp. LJL90]
MKKNKFLHTFLVILLFILPIHQVNATEGTAVDYSIKAILPDNQKNQDLSYFDLRVEPNTTQTIEVQVNNYSDETQKYFVEVNTAQTNGNLLIDYGSSEIPETSNNQTPISEFINYPKEIEIPPQKAGVISFEINVPTDAFDGVMLGGIHIKKDFSDESSNDNQITSQYDYVLGLVLSENDNPVIPEVVFDSINPENITNNAGIAVRLENPTKTTIKNVTMSGHIYQDGSDTPLISREISKGSIAPESVFDLFFFNGDTGTTKPLEAGEYRLEMTLADDQEHKWTINEPFTITAKQAQQVNNEVFTTTSDNTLLYIAIGVLSGLILVALSIVIFRKVQLKKHQKKMMQRKQAAKKKNHKASFENPQGGKKRRRTKNKKES